MESGKRQLSIEYVPLTTVKRWPRNPKEHDLGVIHQSMARFGFVNPLIVNEATGELLAGHGRLDTLEQRHKAGEPPPDGIQANNGHWMIPVVRGITLATEEAAAYAIADNRLVEIGGWADAELEDLLQGMNLDGVGYDDDDVDRLLRELEGGGTPLPAPEVEGDDTRSGQFVLVYRSPDERALWLSKLGLENTPPGRVMLTIEDLDAAR